MSETSGHFRRLLVSLLQVLYHYKQKETLLDVHTYRQIVIRAPQWMPIWHEKRPLICTRCSRTPLSHLMLFANIRRELLTGAQMKASSTR